MRSGELLVMAELMGNPVASPHMPALAQGSWYLGGQRHMRAQGRGEGLGLDIQVTSLLPPVPETRPLGSAPMRSGCRGGSWGAYKCRLWCQRALGEKQVGESRWESRAQLSACLPACLSVCLFAGVRVLGTQVRHQARSATARLCKQHRVWQSWLPGSVNSTEA